MSDGREFHSRAAGGEPRRSDDLRGPAAVAPALDELTRERILCLAQDPTDALRRAAEGAIRDLRAIEPRDVARETAARLLVQVIRETGESDDEMPETCADLARRRLAEAERDARAAVWHRYASTAPRLRSQAPPDPAA